MLITAVTFIMNNWRVFLPLGVLVAVLIIGWVALDRFEANIRSEVKEQARLDQLIAAEKAQKQITELRKSYEKLIAEIPEGNDSCDTPSVDYAIDSLRTLYHPTSK